MRIRLLSILGSDSTMFRGWFALTRAVAWLKRLTLAVEKIAKMLERSEIGANTSTGTWRGYYDDKDRSQEPEYHAPTDEELWKMQEVMRRANNLGQTLTMEEVAAQMESFKEDSADE